MTENIHAQKLKLKSRGTHIKVKLVSIGFDPTYIDIVSGPIRVFVLSML
jgi:hypothetical protein